METIETHNVPFGSIKDTHNAFTAYRIRVEAQNEKRFFGKKDV